MVLMEKLKSGLYEVKEIIIGLIGVIALAIIKFKEGVKGEGANDS